ncbi:MAG TPA: hypothetical protein VHK45_09445 [Geminicoccaceae bacterium]|nr:hypothetical protein [Geminicoccaceae bacterium]
MANVLPQLIELAADLGEPGGFLRQQVGKERDDPAADQAADDAGQPAER